MFIARTRFSLFLPNSNGWNISRNLDNIEITKYKDKLFEKKRLGFRIKFLTNITLPLLEIASKGYDFLHVIEYSDCLPIEYIYILKELEEKYVFVKLNLYDENGKPNKKINSIAIEHFSLDTKKKDVFIGRFTLDDDDCVSLNYFKIMNQYLSSSFEDFYISIGLGVVGVFNEEYKLVHCAEMYKPKVNIGFMNVGRYYHEDQKIYFSEKNTAHMNMDKVNRVILDSRDVGFYWSRHYSQDTRLGKTDKKLDIMMNSLKNLPALNENYLIKHFGSIFYNELRTIDQNTNKINRIEE